jgi:hypothetical protein
MPDDEVVDQEIKHPVKDKVSSSASGITKELRRENLPKRRIEKIYNPCYYLRQTVHMNCFWMRKGTAF